MKTIDTRDLYKRLCELETLRDTVTEAENDLREAELQGGEVVGDGLPSPEEMEAALDDARDSLQNAKDEFGEDEQAELAELETLRDEIGESVFMDGEYLIHGSDFKSHAREVAEDMEGGNIARWPYNCVDWDEAAEQLAMDYSTVTYQGEDYFIRA